mgnify:CR=1 FL=1
MRLPFLNRRYDTHHMLHLSSSFLIGFIRNKTENDINFGQGYFYYISTDMAALSNVVTPI